MGVASRQETRERGRAATGARSRPSRFTRARSQTIGPPGFGSTGRFRAAGGRQTVRMEDDRRAPGGEHAASNMHARGMHAASGAELGGWGPMGSVGGAQNGQRGTGFQGSQAAGRGRRGDGGWGVGSQPGVVLSPARRQRGGPEQVSPGRAMRQRTGQDSSWSGSRREERGGGRSAGGQDSPGYSPSHGVRMFGFGRGNGDRGQVRQPSQAEQRGQHQRNAHGGPQRLGSTQEDWRAPRESAGPGLAQQGTWFGQATPGHQGHGQQPAATGGAPSRPSGVSRWTESRMRQPQSSGGSSYGGSPDRKSVV